MLQCPDIAAVAPAPTVSRPPGSCGKPQAGETIRDIARSLRASLSQVNAMDLMARPEQGNDYGGPLFAYAAATAKRRCRAGSTGIISTVRPAHAAPPNGGYVTLQAPGWRLHRVRARPNIRRGWSRCRSQQAASGGAK